jgi:hypothetical protein
LGKEDPIDNAYAGEWAARADTKSFFENAEKNQDKADVAGAVEGTGLSAIDADPKAWNGKYDDIADTKAAIWADQSDVIPQYQGVRCSRSLDRQTIGRSRYAV